MSQSLQTAFRTLLSADAAVAALVGDRIRPDQLGEADTLPAIIVEIASATPATDLNGAGDTGQAVVDVVCIGTTRAAATAVEQAVRSALNGYRGTAAGHTLAPITYDGTTFDVEPADDGSDQDGDDWFLNVVRFDVWVQH